MTSANKFSGIIVVFGTIIAFALSGTRLFGFGNPPESNYEQVPGGFSIALGFDGRCATIDVKTASKSDLQIRSPWSDSIQLFYINEKGEQILLPRQHTASVFHDDIAEVINEVDVLGPGQMNLPTYVSLWYSDDDVAVIESHPVFCRLALYDPATKQTIKIESSPKMLAPLVPGTAVFRTYVSWGGPSIHGEFKLADGSRIYIHCSANGWTMTRREDFYISFLCPEIDPLPRIPSVKVRGGNYNKNFEGLFEHTGEKGWMGLMLAGPLPLPTPSMRPWGAIPFEELRQIADAHEVVIEVENFKNLGLNESQLAQIRALLAYIDKFPETKVNPDPAAH